MRIAFVIFLGLVFMGVVFFTMIRHGSPADALAPTTTES